MTKVSLSTGAKLPLPKKLRTFLKPLIQKAQSTQTPLYLIGGCVRDLLLGKESLDIDVVMEGPADSLARASARAYRAKLVSHPQFLTHTLIFKNGRHLDLAAARLETYAEPGALPVVEAASLQDDLYRRDFSINAIALSLNPEDFGHVWDPFGGVEDLKAGKLRVLHGNSFKDDPTRLFRAARFGGRFGYELEWRTREWLNECAAQQMPSKLSGARLREELIPLLMEKDPRAAFVLLQEWNALECLVPQLNWDKSHHALMGHALKQKTAAKGSVLLPRLLALLHAVPQSKAVGAMTQMMFPQALVESVDQALAILGQLREGRMSAASSKALQKRPLPSEMKSFLEKAMRIRLNGAGKDAEAQWKKFYASTPCLAGQDLRGLGYKPGPVFTKIFDALREAKWEGKLRTREEEIRFVKATFPLDAR